MAAILAVPVAAVRVKCNALVAIQEQTLLAPQPIGSGKRAMSELVRYCYNTTAWETDNGEWTWWVILERSGRFREVPVKHLVVNVPSFSQQDEMPGAGRKYHLACYGRFRIEDGVGIIDPAN